jgi:hypothetical protein
MWRTGVVLLAACGGAVAMFAGGKGLSVLERQFHDPVSSAGPAPSPSPAARRTADLRTQKAPTTPKKAASSAPGTFRLAWAPVAGASAYEVALYRSKRRVFEQQTGKPELLISTGASGGAQVVAAGRYRWYVWPVRHGVRDTVAVVRSQLVVPG